jgi:hypothetical protein
MGVCSLHSDEDRRQRLPVHQQRNSLAQRLSLLGVGARLQRLLDFRRRRRTIEMDQHRTSPTPRGTFFLAHKKKERLETRSITFQAPRVGSPGGFQAMGVQLDATRRTAGAKGWVTRRRLSQALGVTGCTTYTRTQPSLPLDHAVYCRHFCILVFFRRVTTLRGSSRPRSRYDRLVKRAHTSLLDDAAAHTTRGGHSQLALRSGAGPPASRLLPR